MNDVLARHLSWIGGFLLRWLGRFPQDRRLARIDGRTNCATWQAGHIAGNRRAIARQIDCELGEPAWLPLFRPGSSGDPTEDWPDLPVIVEDLQATADRLCECLESVGSEFVDEEVPHVLSDGRVSRAENVVFLLYHEGFHAGQIEQARRLLEG
jgi:hypothetical protein